MKRVLDAEIERKPEGADAVLVRGPKWCDKTSTHEQFTKSALRMRGPDTYASNMEAAGVRPSPLLRGTRPRFIDE